MELKYTPLDERELKGSPTSYTQGTTALHVTRSLADPRWHVEAVSVTAEGFRAQRNVFTAATRAEIAAFLTGISWNPGGPIARPIEWLAKTRSGAR